MSRHTTVLPAAGRLMASLRDIGYDPASAVADLVDNSIDAAARSIEITVHADGEDSWLRVTDDGLGMSAAALDEAMRYGSASRYDQKSLGHFGLGLKTASLSQCRRLTVASRRGPRGRLNIRRWDLDAVLARDSWDLEHVAPRDAPAYLCEALHAGSGTVVLWEGLDRLLPRRATSGLTARVLDRVAEDVTRHASMVFHRFLSGEAFDDRGALRLTVNGQALLPWDPFARDEPATRSLPSRTVVSPEDASLELEVRPYVLPSQLLFSSPEAHRRAAGPNRWNRHQGLYIYRRDRLIQAGGWNRLRTLDEHAKLARIAVDLPAGGEERFSVDVAKMRVRIPEELREELKAIAASAVAVAQETYREGVDEEPELDDFEPTISADEDGISISRDWPAILNVVESVLGDVPELRDRLLLRLANADPTELEADASANANKAE